MKVQRIDVRIEGLTPLLCNRFTDDEQIRATEGTRSSLGGDRGEAREQAESKLYTDEKGRVGIPQPNVLRCIVDAGKYFKENKRQVTTATNSMVPGFLDIPSVFIPLDFPEPWEVDTRPVRVPPKTGGRILNHRPRFDKWALDFAIDLDLEQYTAKKLRDLIDVAGKRIGLGDYRPDLKGPFGKFIVTRWEVEKD